MVLIAIQEEYNSTFDRGQLIIKVAQLKNKESSYKALYKDQRYLKDQSRFRQDLETGVFIALLKAQLDML